MSLKSLSMISLSCISSYTYYQCFAPPILKLNANHFDCDNGTVTTINRNRSSRTKIRWRGIHHNQILRDGVCCCGAHFQISDDAPFAVAIGACMLSSLLLPVTDDDSATASDSDLDSNSSSALDSTDTRFAVMGIISFIPYFNWLSWVFAWLDAGKRRYIVYALVYLIPYLRSNLSLSPEESWLPIASIVLCVFHIQLEASVRNGDIQGIQLFRKVDDQLLSSPRKRSHINEHLQRPKGRAGEEIKLPPPEDQSREPRNWIDPESTSNCNLKEDTDDGNETPKY